MKVCLVATLLAFAASADAITLCTTPDGKKYAGDNPPPNCEVTTRLENSAPAPAPAPSADELEAAVESGVGNAIEDAKAKQEAAVMATAIRERRQIERELDRLEDELANVERDLANVQAVNPGNYKNTTAGWQQYEQDLQNKSAYETRLHSKKVDLQIALGREKGKFEALTRDLKLANGGVLPPSWGPLR